MIQILRLLFEVILAAGGLIFVYSQVLRPIVKNTPVFPMFRRRPNLESEIEGVNEQLEEKQLEGELAKKRRKLGDSSKPQ